jgi:IS30 family transposase
MRLQQNNVQENRSGVQHSTMGEREQLAGFLAMLAMNMRIRAIATAMKRHPSTIARERSRGTIDGEYSATGAATAAKTHRKNSGFKGRYSFSMAMKISGLLGSIGRQHKSAEQ